MALRLYQDDCANAHQLANLLRQAGHTVIRPIDVGLDKADDCIHLAFAAQHGLTLITKNPADFLVLHRQNSQHSGIVAVCQDNDAIRDMTDAEIVKAIANLEAATQSGGDPIPGMFHILNNWRY